MTDEARVREMVRAGTISDAEGARLISAMSSRRGTAPLLLMPFERLSTSVSSIAAAVALAAGIAVAPLGVRFDGALDLHLASSPSWRLALLDTLNAVGVVTVALWIAGLAAARRGRPVDTLSAVAIARLPLVLLALLLSWIAPPPAEALAQAASGTLSPRLLITAVVTLPLWIWFLALLYRGFVHSAGLKSGVKAAALFTVAILAAEVVSKLVLAYFT
jgi:hypothetical protein